MSNTHKTFLAEFLLGGTSSAASGVFTNPLDVIKISASRRTKKARYTISFCIFFFTGNYQIVYKNVFHAAYTIAKSEGSFALQKGLVPALLYQFVMNGFRFGTFQCLENNGLLKNKDNETSFIKTMVAAAIAGGIGSFIGSPFFYVKTQLQSKAAEKIAVGFQHEHSKMSDAFKAIYKKNGILGIYNNSSSAMIRTTIGSCVQLTSFTQSRLLFERFGIVKHDSWVSNIFSAFTGGICVCIFMTPFDVALTRLYNQPVDPKTGKGLIYKSLFDTFYKTIKHENFFGLYKGITSSILRQLPHSLINLFFWQELRKFYYN